MDGAFSTHGEIRSLHNFFVGKPYMKINGLRDPGIDGNNIKVDLVECFVKRWTKFI
jgi:hypothetical protein